MRAFTSPSPPNTPPLSCRRLFLSTCLHGLLPGDWLQECLHTHALSEHPAPPCGKRHAACMGPREPPANKKAQLANVQLAWVPCPALSPLSTESHGIFLQRLPPQARADQRAVCGALYVSCGATPQRALCVCRLVVGFMEIRRGNE